MDSLRDKIDEKLWYPGQGVYDAFVKIAWEEIDSRAWSVIFGASLANEPHGLVVEELIEERIFRNVMVLVDSKIGQYGFGR